MTSSQRHAVQPPQHELHGGVAPTATASPVPAPPQMLLDACARRRRDIAAPVQHLRHRREGHARLRGNRGEGHTRFAGHHFTVSAPVTRMRTEPAGHRRLARWAASPLAWISAVSGRAAAEDPGEGLANAALPEGERVGEPLRLVGSTPSKPRRSRRTIGLGEHDVADVAVDPRRAPHGYGSKSGNSSAKSSSIGSRMWRTPVSVEPHESTPSRAFFSSTGAMRRRYGGVGAAWTSALQADVLVRPQRPARVVRGVDVELVLQQPVALASSRRVAACRPGRTRRPRSACRSRRMYSVRARKVCSTRSRSTYSPRLVAGVRAAVDEPGSA